MRHRVYRLRSRVSLMGLELTDWFVILLSWLVCKQFFSSFLGVRLSLLTAIIATFLVFKGWQGVKDNVPDKYATHLASWLTEADIYRLKPDTKNVPPVVYPEALAGFRSTTPSKPGKEVSRGVAPAEG